MKLTCRLLICLITAALLLPISGCRGEVQSPSSSNKPAAAPSIAPAAASQRPTPPLQSPSNPASSADAADINSTPDAETVNSVSDFSSPGWALMENESLGGICYRMCESELTALIGPPESMSDAIYCDTDRLHHTQWYYPSLGLVIDMLKQADDVESSVFSIDVKAPCTLSLDRGIAIGDTKAAALKAYTAEYNAGESDNTTLVLGTRDGGIIIALVNDTVSAIFIGTAGE